MAATRTQKFKAILENKDFDSIAKSIKNQGFRHLDFDKFFSDGRSDIVDLHNQSLCATHQIIVARLLTAWINSDSKTNTFKTDSNDKESIIDFVFNSNDETLIWNFCLDISGAALKNNLASFDKYWDRKNINHNGGIEYAMGNLFKETGEYPELHAIIKAKYEAGDGLLLTVLENEINANLSTGVSAYYLSGGDPAETIARKLSEFIGDSMKDPLTSMGFDLDTPADFSFAAMALLNIRDELFEALLPHIQSGRSPHITQGDVTISLFDLVKLCGQHMWTAPCIDKVRAMEAAEYARSASVDIRRSLGF